MCRGSRNCPPDLFDGAAGGTKGPQRNAWSQGAAFWLHVSPETRPTLRRPVREPAGRGASRRPSPTVCVPGRPLRPRCPDKRRRQRAVPHRDEGPGGDDVERGGTGGVLRQGFDPQGLADAEFMGERVHDDATVATADAGRRSPVAGRRSPAAVRCGRRLPPGRRGVGRSPPPRRHPVRPVPGRSATGRQISSRWATTPRTDRPGQPDTGRSALCGRSASSLVTFSRVARWAT
jgi:hypothetical protein